MSGEADIPQAARLDALLRLQLEEQNQSRHHEVLRDRAIGNMILVNAAMLAILGAIFQAKLEDAPTIMAAGRFLIPSVVIVFGLFAFVASNRHSVQAARHWSLARFYREQVFLILDGSAAKVPLASAREAASDKFEAERGFSRRRPAEVLGGDSARTEGQRSRWTFWRGSWLPADGPHADWTRRIWLSLPLAMMLAGAAMFVAAYKDSRWPPPIRAETNVRILLDGGSEVRISPAILERWFDLQRNLSTPPDPAPQRTD